MEANMKLNIFDVIEVKVETAYFESKVANLKNSLFVLN